VAGLANGHVDRRKSGLHGAKQGPQPGEWRLDQLAEIVESRRLHSISNHMPSLPARLNERRQTIGTAGKSVQKT
jgi:hypothetical protein